MPFGRLFALWLVRFTSLERLFFSWLLRLANPKEWEFEKRLNYLADVYFSVFAQTNFDSISGRFQQLSKQLADLEKFVYNNDGELTKVISSGQQKRIDALENAVKELRGIVEVDLSLLKQEGARHGLEQKFCKD